MRRVLLNTAALLFLLMLSSLSWSSDASIGLESSKEDAFIDNPGTPADSLPPDTLGPLHYPFKDEGPFVKSGPIDTSALYLRKPSNIRTEIEYDATTGEYLIYEKVDDFDYRLPRSLSREEYLKLDIRESVDRYWRERMAQNNLDQRSQLIPQIRVSGETFSKVFGTNVVNIRPQGYVEMSLGVRSSKIENPAIPVKMQRNTTFDFDQKINVNLEGEVGDRLKMRFNYNTDATFDFENKIKLDYTGHEDDIFKYRHSF